MNLEENSVIASDVFIEKFPCSKSFLIFDRGCQSSGMLFLPFSSLLEEVWTLKYLNSGNADWSGIGLGILSVAGPVQAISCGPSVTQQCLHNEPSFPLHDPSRARGWGYFQKNWVGVCGPLPKALTLFMTKICDIPYPIYDLTKNSKPNLWPDPHIKILFQTCILISFIVQTNFKLP